MNQDKPGLVEFENRLRDMATVNVPLGQVQPRWSENVENNGIVNRHLTFVVLPDGRTLEVTGRFLRSLASRFHVGRDMFKYFPPDEVFARVQMVHPRANIRLMIDGKKALAMSNPTKAWVMPEDICRLLREQDNVQDVEYNEGIVVSTHMMDDADWSVGQDAFKQTFTLETPIDGFGLPSVYLSLIRQICENGMVGYAPAFRQTITIGKDDGDNVLLPLRRVMDCFNNDEGFDALRERLTAALVSEASVHEVRMLTKAVRNDLAGRREHMLRVDDVFKALGQLTGDIALMFNVATEEAISPKKQHQLAMNCTVYDLLNFATEITSHYSDLLARGANKTIAWVGQMLSQDYDLERSLERVDENWEDIDKETDREHARRRLELRDREAPAFHLDGTQRSINVISAISGEPMREPDPLSVEAERLGDSWEPGDADDDAPY